jgi:tetratricopeptide (TPR) repeat protein
LDDDPSGRWFDLFLAAQAAAKGGDNARALELYWQVAELDAGRADLHFQIGRSHFARGEFDQARLAFERAVDFDVCPLRATSEIQGLIEQTAIDEQVPLVDFNTILRGACTDLHGHPCPGNEFFLDHVHPTVAAHRLLALSIVEAMARAGIVAPRQQWDEETIVDVTKRIESRIDPELQARALTNLAQVLSWAGKQLEAGPIAELAVALRRAANLGDDPETMFYAAVNYAVKGMDDEAIELLQKFVLLQPDDPQARWRLAVLLYEQDRLEESLEQFRTAVRLDPQDLYSQQMLGHVLLKLERYEEARSTMELALEIAPDDPLIKRNLAAAREKLPQS